MYLCNKNQHTVHFYDSESLAVHPLTSLFNPLTGQITDSDGIYVLFINDTNIKLIRTYKGYIKLKMLAEIDLTKTIKKLQVGAAVPVRDVAQKTTFEIKHEAPVVAPVVEEVEEEEEVVEVPVPKATPKRKIKKTPVVEPVEEELEEEELEEELEEEELEEEEVAEPVVEKPVVKKVVKKAPPKKKSVKRTVKKSSKSKKK